MRIHGQSSAALTSLFFAIVVSAGCSSGSGSGGIGEITEVVETQGTPVHVSFSGGGWRAHTGHAGWTMGLLEDGAYTVGQAFDNVQTLSSNSGGTWFLSMLTYSEAFRSSIEAQGAFDNYITPSGYLGQERVLFDDFEATLVDSNWCPFASSEPLFYFYCRLAAIAGDGALIWSDIVSNVVFQPFGMNKSLEKSSTLLSDPRQSWATGKSVLIAATMLTDHVILTETDYLLDKLYYDATLSGAGPEQVNVTPVTFASVQSGKIPPSVLSAGDFDVTYTEADFGNSAKASLMNNALVSDSVPVLLATSASSAAVGAAASYAVLRANGYDHLTWEMAYELSDLAVPVNLLSPIRSGTPLAQSVDELSSSHSARLADGGYVDNSAVAQLVSFLQANSEATDFQIVAFDNIQNLYTPPSGTVAVGAQIGLDIALLFGQGGQNQACAGTGKDQFCVTVPAQQVFTLIDPHTTTPVTWSWTAQGAVAPTLSYTQYKVSTVDNPTFGVMAGSQGVLHVFTCVWPTADTAPWNGASDFDAYQAMLAAIRTGLYASGNEGLDHLRRALSGEVSL